MSVGRIRVEVDRALCRGYANCLDIAPDVFDLDSTDVAVVREADYPMSRSAELVAAARRCPAGAIVVIAPHMPPR